MTNNDTGDNYIRKKVLERAARQTGIPGDALSNAINKGDLSGIFSNVDSDTAEKIKSVLSNKQAAEKLLASDEAKKLMQALSENEQGS